MQLLRLKVILAAFDYDDSSLAPLRAAHGLATAAAATLHAIHVSSVTERAGTAADDARAMLERAGIHADRAQLHIVSGDPAHAIGALSDRVQADVIVLGPHRAHSAARGGPRLGSTALAVVTNSWASCLVVSRSLTLPFRRVLVPVDLSDTARGALVVGLSWASALRPAAGAGRGEEIPKTTAELTALHVRRPSTSRDDAVSVQSSLDEELRRVRAEAGTWAGVDVDDEIVESSDIASAIADASRARRAELVVLGTRGLGLDSTGRLGSVSAAVTRLLDVPVLLVPPAVWTAMLPTPVATS